MPGLKLRLVHSVAKHPSRSVAAQVQARDAAPRGFSFAVMPPPGLRLKAWPAQRLDLGRLVRVAGRRHLEDLREVGRALNCQPRGTVTGRWSRRWCERVIGGMIPLAAQLVPGSTVSLRFGQAGQRAMVEAVCAAQDGGEVTRPFEPRRLTQAREQWQLEFWLWRAIAQRGRGRVSLLRDDRGPIGIRWILPGLQIPT